MNTKIYTFGDNIVPKNNQKLLDDYRYIGILNINPVKIEKNKKLLRS